MDEKRDIAFIAMGNSVNEAVKKIEDKNINVDIIYTADKDETELYKETTAAAYHAKTVLIPVTLFSPSEYPCLTDFSKFGTAALRQAIAAHMIGSCVITLTAMSSSHYSTARQTTLAILDDPCVDYSIVIFTDGMNAERADEELSRACEILVYILSCEHTGLLNMDSDDFRDWFGGRKNLVMSLGIGEGENAALKAAVSAAEKLKVSFDDVERILINLDANEDEISLVDVQTATEYFKEKISDEDSGMCIVSTFNNELKEKIIVAVIASY